MVKTSIPDDSRAEHRLLGRAVAAVRIAAGLTQQQAADRAIPRMSSQNWGMHETGKVAGIEKRAVLRRLAEALGAELDDIEAARQMIEADDAQRPATPAMRLRALAGGLSEARSFAGERPGQVRRAEFPLSEGQAVLVFPTDLSPDGFRELAAYLGVFLSTHGQELTTHS